VYRYSFHLLGLLLNILPSLDNFLVRPRPIYDSLRFLFSMPLRRLHSFHNPSIAPVSSQWHKAPEPSVSMYYPPIAPSAKCVLCIFIEYRTGGISRKYNVEE
jgi:hypothetical protein